VNDPTRSRSHWSRQPSPPTASRPSPSTATGTASKDVTLVSDKLKTVTVAGAADVGLVTSAKTVDASTATGKVAVDVSGATADATNKASVKTGTGADTITVSQANFNANFSVDGGEGNDTLVVNSTATGTPSVTFGTVTSVETLQLKVSGAQATGGTPVNRTLTADASKVASANAFVLENAQTHAHTAYTNENATFTLNNVGAAATVTVLAASGNITDTDTAINLPKQNEGTTAVTINLKDATGTADAVTVEPGCSSQGRYRPRGLQFRLKTSKPSNYVVQAPALFPWLTAMLLATRPSTSLAVPMARPRPSMVWMSPPPSTLQP